MTQLLTEIVGGEPYEYLPLGEYVVRAPGVCGGRPTFKYTRIDVTWVLQRLAAGERIEELVADYQGRISAEAIREACDIVTRSFLAALPELAAA
jgi:uncharacterized protein (DUF433 family)